MSHESYDDVRAEMISAIPSLRAFAHSLSGNPDTSDDLVQETLAKALTNIVSFTPGTSMSAWLFTILRNHFYSAYRKRRKEVEDPDERHALALSTPPTQVTSVAFGEFARALQSLSPQQREALYLVEVLGFSFEEAAAVMGTGVNTAKSRTIRGRAALVAMMAPDGDRQAVLDPEFVA